MINYKTKAEGMTYIVGDSCYTIKHAIVKLIDFRQGAKIKMHIMFPGGNECVCEPFLDDNIKLEKGCFLKIAYIDLDRGNSDDIRIHGYELADISDVDESLYLEPVLKPFGDVNVDINNLYEKAQRIGRSLKNAQLKSLLENILEQYKDKLLTCPAGTSVHHNYPGGLLQHSISVAELAYTIGYRYSGVDLDLLVTASLLHDIGKTIEYNSDGSLTDTGIFRDHITIGAEIVDKACEACSLDTMTRNHLVHLIISHHGEEAWGSTRKPATLEAFILHQADYIDSQVFIYNNGLRQLKYGETAFNKYLNRNVVQTNFMQEDSYLK